VAVVHHGGAAAVASLRPGGQQAGHGALVDDVPLELGEGGHHGEEKLALAGGRVAAGQLAGEDPHTGHRLVPLVSCNVLKRWAAWPPVIRVAVLVVCVLAAFGVAVAFIWPFTDLIGQHDVGLTKGPQRALQLQAARAAVRTQLLTFGAGVLAAGALAFTAWNVTLYRKNLTIIEQGQVTDRYAKAIEQLGSDNLHVRIGGIYALQRIAGDSATYQPIVIEVLTAFLREQRPTSDVSQDEKRSTPSDVQAAVTVVGRRNRKHDIRLINLTRADLAGADLTGADLLFAGLTEADLTEADLTGADLTTARPTIGDPNPKPTNLTGADLRDAKFSGADLTGAILTRADYTPADPTESDPNPKPTNLTGADLTDVKFTPATLALANLTGAKWSEDVPPPRGWVYDHGQLRRDNRRR
jgi:hypothetical protein